MDEEPRGLEEVEQRIPVAEDRARDEPSAREAEHVPVTRVAARDPDAVLLRHRADDGEEVEDQAEDPGPAVVDADRPSDESRRRSARALPGRPASSSSSAVNSESSETSRNPPATMRPSARWCQ